MSVNNMTIEQASAFLGAIVSQMQGGALASVSTGNFVSVAQNALKQGYEPLLNAISQVLARTIFSIRPYRGKLSGLLVDNQKYGAITRKINYIDGVLEDDQRIYYTGTTPYANGDSPNPDQWAFRKPAVWQSNWYGSDSYQRVTSILRDQIDTAMSSPSMFAEFISGQIQNIVDQLEQVNDAKARAALINYIGGKIQLATDDGTNATHVVHLFQEYAADTGVTLTLATYLAPSNFRPFAEWLYARIATLTDMMAERGHKFNFSPTLAGSKAWIERHTPKDRMKAFFVADAFNKIQAMAISEVFNKEELRMIEFTPVNFWQSAADPYNITAEVTVNDAAVNITGPSVDDLKTVSVTTKGTPDTPVLGVIMDEEACGLTIINEGVYDSGLNAASLVNNRFWHIQTRMWADFCESGVVLLLD